MDGTDSWSFTRGAPATVDREFGFLGRSLSHEVIETHVTTEHVSTIPFYPADEATEAIKPNMDRQYLSNTKDGSTGSLKSLWTSVRWCQRVEESSGALGKDVVF